MHRCTLRTRTIVQRGRHGGGARAFSERLTSVYLPYVTPQQPRQSLAERGLPETHARPVWLGVGPLGLAVAGPMTGQANCRGLNHRVAQGSEYPPRGPFPPFACPPCLGWGRGSLSSCCTWSPQSGPPPVTASGWSSCLQSVPAEMSAGCSPAVPQPRAECALL